MKTDEQQVLKDFFQKFKGLYYKQKVTDDIIERILRKLPADTLPAEILATIEDKDWKLTEIELKEMESRINKL